MRLYSVRVILGILVLAVFVTQLLAPSIVGSSIEASVEIKPETLNLEGKGVITVFIREFSDPSYNVSDIDCSTIELHVEGGAGFVVPMRCVVDEGELVAKFDGSNVADLILVKLGHMQLLPKDKYRVDLVVEGRVNGELFDGSDGMRVMLP